MVRRYTEKIKVVPDEVRHTCRLTGFAPILSVSHHLMPCLSVKVHRWLFQDCTICMERLVMSSGYEGILQHKGLKPELVGKLGKCGHMYHLLCLVAMYNNGNKVGKSWRPTRCCDVTLSST